MCCHSKHIPLGAQHTHIWAWNEGGSRRREGVKAAFGQAYDRKLVNTITTPMLFSNKAPVTYRGRKALATKSTLHQSAQVIVLTPTLVRQHSDTNSMRHCLLLIIRMHKLKFAVFVLLNIYFFSCADFLLSYTAAIEPLHLTPLTLWYCTFSPRTFHIYYTATSTI